MLSRHESLAERNWRHYKNTVYAKADADYIVDALIESHGGFLPLVEELCRTPFSLNEEATVMKWDKNQTVGEFLGMLDKMEQNFDESGPYFKAVSAVEQWTKKLLDRFADDKVQKPNDMEDNEFSSVLMEIRNKIKSIQIPFLKIKELKVH